MLSDFGVDYIELTSLVSSPQSYEDCKTICKLGLKSKILTHVRCNMDDAKKAVECGVDGVDLVIGTTSFLREYSHGKSMELIQKTALEVIAYTKSQGVEVRLSSEDSFRSDLVELLTLYKAVDKADVNRV
ncbi:homocitrate synthase lys21 [Neonectria punicea]|uniref:Homocitrate synthase lys21 n=1 Tax=Neonectria punicea TaxID=979145 RepID=A0ABR1GW36_9HYPO